MKTYIAVTRRLLKPRPLLLDSKVVIIKNNQLEANDIRRIYIEGNKEINTLIEWAKNNNIEVNHKTFFKWI